MPELDHHPEPVSLHDCAVCHARGIEVESREYCQVCYRGKRRKNVDSFADKLRGLPFTDALWIAAHANIKTEHAIAAAEMALLKSKLLQAERELAEAREDAQRYRWLTEDHADASTRERCRELLARMPIMSYSSASTDIDAAILAAKEQA